MVIKSSVDYKTREEESATSTLVFLDAGMEGSKHGLRCCLKLIKDVESA